MGVSCVVAAVFASSGEASVGEEGKDEESITTRRMREGGGGVLPLALLCY